VSSSARRWAIGLIAVALAMGGCAGDADRQPGPTVAFTDAVPAAEREVEALPGVVDHDLVFHEGLPVGKAVVGTVEVEPDADPVQVLGDVYAALWAFQAFEPVTIQVAATVDTAEVATAKDLGSISDSVPKNVLREWYGPWPGAGPTSRE